MAQYFKGNSCLLAFDSSPAFTTGSVGLSGQKLGLYFAKLLQDFEFSISPAKTQSKQIGSYDYGVDAVNFSPDVICNLSFITRDDFETEKLLGLNFATDGTYQPVFSGIDDYSFNAYLFFSNQEGYDLARQISGNNTFSGLNCISIGNGYVTNGAINMAVGQTPKSSFSFVASNCVMNALDSNYLQIPAVNLESGNTGGAAEIYLNPNQASRFLEGGVSGALLETWKSTFEPIFQDVQIPNQALTNVNLQSLNLAFSVDRESSYGFGSDYVYGRDVKYPVVGTVDIAGIASEYQTGSFADLMQNESSYDITIYNADPQELYLSGLSNEQISGTYKLDHLTADQWIRIPNAKLRDSNARVGVNGFLEFSNSFDFAATPEGGLNRKRGEPDSLDSVYVYGSDSHRLISRDGYALTFDPFIQFFNDQESCEIVTMLSSDRKICLCLDNFVENRISCPRDFTIPVLYSGIDQISAINSPAYLGDQFAPPITGSLLTTNVNWFTYDIRLRSPDDRNILINYPVIAILTGELRNGMSISTLQFYQSGVHSSGEYPLINTSSYFLSGLKYRVGDKMFDYNDAVENLEDYDGSLIEKGDLLTPSIISAEVSNQNMPFFSNTEIKIDQTFNADGIEFHWHSGDGIYKYYNNISNDNSDPFVYDLDGFISTKLFLIPKLGLSANHLSEYFENGVPTNIFYYTPFAYQDFTYLSGTGFAAVRNTATGLTFQEGATTSSGSARLNWSGFNTGISTVQPITWNVYSFESGVSSPFIYATGFSSTGCILSGLSNISSYYGAMVTTVVEGYESPTGQCEIKYIQRV